MSADRPTPPRPVCLVLEPPDGEACWLAGLSGVAMEILPALGPRDARLLIHREHVDLAVFDAESYAEVAGNDPMPGMPDDAPGFVRMIRQQTRGRDLFPLLAVCGREVPGLRDALVEAGVTDFIDPGADSAEINCRLNLAWAAKHSVDVAAEARRELCALRAAHRDARRALESRELPRHPGWQVYRWDACGQTGAGDYLDIMALPDGRWALVTAHAAIHGICASLDEAAIRSLVGAQMRNGSTAGACLSELNALFSEVSLAAQFIMACVCLVNPQAGEVEHSTAGHPEPVLVAPGCGAQVLESAGGPPLGILPGVEYDSLRSRMPPGSRLYFASNGVWQVPPGGTALDTADWLAMVDAGRAKPLAGAAESIREVLTGRVGGELEDDAGLVVVERCAPPG